VNQDRKWRADKVKYGKRQK